MVYGSSIEREGRNCEFPACPSLQYCDALNPCPEDYDCYDFLNDEREPYCYGKKADPCAVNKCLSRNCDIIETMPIQVKCNE